MTTAPAQHDRYNRSEKGKARSRRYARSAKGKAASSRYNRSEKGRANTLRARSRNDDQRIWILGVRVNLRTGKVG